MAPPATETAPLLGAADESREEVVRKDHPIFLQACHSPWRWINQNVLCYIRGLIFLYLGVTGTMIFQFLLGRYHKGDENAIYFQFPVIAFALLFTYHGVVFAWTFTHLHFTKIRDDKDDNTWEAKILRILSPPARLDDAYRRFYFSMLYTTSHVFVFLNVLIFWGVLVPLNRTGFESMPPEQPPNPIPDLPEPEPPIMGLSPRSLRGGQLATRDTSMHDLIGHHWYQPFCLFNLYGGTAVIAVFEIFMLNCMKTPVPLPSHVFTLVLDTLIYLFWAYVGIQTTHIYPYFFLDPEIIGSHEGVLAYMVGFIGLALIMFNVFYILINIREKISKRFEPAEQSDGQEGV